MKERVFFVPMGNSCVPHPRGVCRFALSFKNDLLRQADEEGSVHIGSAIPRFAGMCGEGFMDWLLPGYTVGCCVVSIEPIDKYLKPAKLE